MVLFSAIRMVEHQPDRDVGSSLSQFEQVGFNEACNLPPQESVRVQDQRPKGSQDVVVQP